MRNFLRVDMVAFLLPLFCFQACPSTVPRPEPQTDKVLEKDTSLSFSTLFYQQLQTDYRDSRYFTRNDSFFEVNNSRGDQYIEIPSTLEYDKVYEYEAHRADTLYSLTLKRLNATDLQFQVNRRCGTNLDIAILDTVSFRKPYARAKGKVGYVFQCIEYKRKFQKGTFQILLSNDKNIGTNNFIDFDYYPNRVHYDPVKESASPYFMGDDLNDLPLFKLKGYVEPYSEYLSTHIRRGIGEGRTRRNNWQKTMDDLISEIDSLGLADSIVADTELMKQMLFQDDYELISMVERFGYKKPESPTSDEVQEVRHEHFPELTALVEQSRNEVISERFVKLSWTHTTIPVDRSDPRPLRQYFNHGFYSDEGKTYLVGDTLFSVMTYCGEACSSILTVWKQQAETYRLLEILDKPPGGGSGIIDSIFTYNDATLIIGHNTGGDGGDMWGGIWLAEWKRPRHLEMHEIVEWAYETDWEKRADFKGKQESASHKIFSDRIEITKTSRGKNPEITTFYFDAIKH